MHPASKATDGRKMKNREPKVALAVSCYFCYFRNAAD